MQPVEAPPYRQRACKVDRYAGCIPARLAPLLEWTAQRLTQAIRQQGYAG